MKKILKISFLVIAVGLIGLLASKVPGSWLKSDRVALAGSGQEINSGSERVVLQVDGMTCRSCVKGIRKALLNVPGVKKAHVSFEEARAELECEKGKATDQQLVKAIEDESNLFFTFTAKVVQREQVP